jgi:hypothetical protein
MFDPGELTALLQREYDGEERDSDEPEPDTIPTDQRANPAGANTPPEMDPR